MCSDPIILRGSFTGISRTTRVQEWGAFIGIGLSWRMAGALLSEIEARFPILYSGVL